MDISSFDMYLLLMLDNIYPFFLVAGICVSSISFLFYIASDAVRELEERELLISKKYKFMFFSGLFMVISSCFIPTTKQAAAIIIAPKIFKSDFVNNTLPKEGKEVYELFKDWLKQEVSKDKNNEKQ